MRVLIRDPLGGIPNWRSRAGAAALCTSPLPADWTHSMSDTPTPPENPDEPQPVTSGDPLGGGSEDPPTAATQPMAAGPRPRRLTRSSSDKVLGGVAGGLGRYFDIDPIIFRIGFVVLALAGGAGVLGYIAAWVLVPADPVPGQEPADRSRAATIAGAVVLGLAALVLIGPGLFFLAPPLIGLALIGLVGVLLWRAAGGPEGDGSPAAKIGLGSAAARRHPHRLRRGRGRRRGRRRRGDRRPRHRDRRRAHGVGVPRRPPLARAARADPRHPARLRRRGRDRRRRRRRRPRLPADLRQRAARRLRAGHGRAARSTSPRSTCRPAARRSSSTWASAACA